MAKDKNRRKMGKHLNHSLRRNYVNSHKALKVASNIIKDLERGKTRLAHIGPMSIALRRPINLYVKSLTRHAFGQQRRNLHTINVTYEDYKPEDYVDYWISDENFERNSKNSDEDVLTKIALKAGVDPGKLRRKTVKIMRNNIKHLATGVNFLLKSIKKRSLKKNSSKYSGKSVQDAKRLLDNSQNGKCHPDGNSGHPRGHASYSGADAGPTGSVENYSRTGWKTGFLSRSDQNLVAHLALQTRAAKNMMDNLNGGSLKEARDINSSDLDADDLPMAQQWQNGTPLGRPEHFNRVCLVLKHFLNKQNDPSADPFILTFYPVLRRG